MTTWRARTAAVAAPWPGARRSHAAATPTARGRKATRCGASSGGSGGAGGSGAGPGGGAPSTAASTTASTSSGAGGGASCTGEGTSDLEGVSIVFPEQPCTFTLAEAQAGIAIAYSVVVEQQVPALLPVPQDGGECDQPGASGLILFEVLAGGGHQD